MSKALIDKQLLRKIAGEELYHVVKSHFHDNLGEDCRHVEIKFEECLKYLFLLSRFNSVLAGKFMPLVGEVDEVWHYLIIQTREYENLCQRLPGQIFLHHKSLTYQKYTQVDVTRQEMVEEMLSWVPLFFIHPTSHSKP